MPSKPECHTAYGTEPPPSHCRHHGVPFGRCDPVPMLEQPATRQQRWMGWRSWMYTSGLRWQMVCAHLLESLSFTTRVPPEQAGNTFCVERRFRAATLSPRMEATERTMVRSQAGPNAGVALSTCLSSPLTRIESPLFRVLLQRRLSLPLPLSQRICGCGLPNDPFGHHRAACSWTGVVGKEGVFSSRALQPGFAEKLEDVWRPTCS